MLLSLCVAPVAAAQSVSDLWRQNCLMCHGARGQGGGAGTRSMLTEEMRALENDRVFFEAIKNGLPDKGMVAFGRTLSDEQVWGLVVHIRELQAAEFRKKNPDVTPEDGVYRAKDHAFKLETVVPGGVDVPWSVDFLPGGVDGKGGGDEKGGAGGMMLVTGRSGDLRVHSTGRAGGKLSEPVKGTPKVRNRGQGGLMDVAVHPEYATNGWVYLSYSEEILDGKRSTGMTTIVRGKLKKDGDGWSWTDQETLFRAKPEHFLPTDLHFGCRIVFTEKQADGRRLMFFPIGERGRMEMAQDLKRPNGKVHRLWDDGEAPKDNPFVGQEGAYPSIWSYGHRNPQGLAFDLQGRLWDTEHGPRGGDEVNLVEKGKNYGWPIVSFGINYSGEPFRTPWGESAIAMPAFHWTPSIGACGLDVARGPAFAKWKGDLLAGGLSGTNVDRLRVKEDGSVEREELLHGIGRVRDVVCGPDGSVYVVLNDPDSVVRMVEVE